MAEAADRSQRNPCAVPTGEIPAFAPEAFRREAIGACREGGRIVALFALPRPSGEPGHDVYLVLAHDAAGTLRMLRTFAGAGEALPSLASELPEAQAFERELCEQHGIAIAGHPWPKPLRRHAEAVPGGAAPGPAHPFFQVDGPGIHEVAVGPVHAGIIEPGHFRFQCAGERVLSLEIQLGYQHRGAETLLVHGTPARRLIVAESIAGDTAVGHAIAHCMAMEALAGCTVPLAAEALRGIALELERCANHVGDLGALAGDVAYLPGAAWLGRLRGDLLNLLMELSGNRYGRGLVSVGGVRRGLGAPERKVLADRLATAEAEVKSVADLMFDAASVLARFEGTGAVSERTARDLGLVGPAARASGVARDVRGDHPAGIFRFAHIPVTVASSGDVMARALVRRLEAQRSLAFLREQVRELPDGPLAVPAGAAAPGRLAVALVEGWRGEIAHVAVTGEDGRLSGYKVVDPSFHNWFALAMAMRDGAISDFPLCNKSFNLSYAGHDL